MIALWIQQESVMKAEYTGCSLKEQLKLHLDDFNKTLWHFFFSVNSFLEVLDLTNYCCRFWGAPNLKSHLGHQHSQSRPWFDDYLDQKGKPSSVLSFYNCWVYVICTFEQTMIKKIMVFISILNAPNKTPP